MKDTLNNIRTDIEIIKESISNGDTKDAIQMLNEIQSELEILTLIC